MENVDSRIIAYAKTCRNGEMTTEGFKASINSMSLTAKSGTAALKTLSIASNILVMWGIKLFVSCFDNRIHSVEKANESMKDAVGEFESASSSFESVNSELKEQNKKLDELLAKDKLTYAEKNNLRK